MVQPQKETNAPSITTPPSPKEAQLLKLPQPVSNPWVPQPVSLPWVPQPVSLPRVKNQTPSLHMQKLADAIA